MRLDGQKTALAGTRWTVICEEQEVILTAVGHEVGWTEDSIGWHSLDCHL